MFETTSDYPERRGTELFCRVRPTVFVDVGNCDRELKGFTMRGQVNNSARPWDTNLVSRNSFSTSSNER